MRFLMMSIAGQRTKRTRRVATNRRHKPTRPTARSAGGSSYTESKWLEEEERGNMALIAIDIDGTLGYRDRQEYMRTCNETLNLAIAEERLQHISSLNAFYQLPEVQAYKERVGEVYYKKAIGWIDFHPQ